MTTAHNRETSLCYGSGQAMTHAQGNVEHVSVTLIPPAGTSAKAADDFLDALLDYLFTAVYDGGWSYVASMHMADDGEDD